MILSRQLVLACLLCQVTPGLAWAQLGPGFGQSAPPAGPQPGWVRYTEPSEHAYTVDVPQGWTVAGGVRRYAPSEVPTWLTVQSPDGATEMFLGDPALPFFVLPQPGMPEGGQMPFMHNRAATVMPYKPGAEFAAFYAARNLPSVCQNLQQAGAQPIPAVEDEARRGVQTATRVDGGEADFTCQRNGQPTAAAVVAGTVLVSIPGSNNFGVWGAAVLRGFVTPASSRAQAAQVLAHVAATFQLDPQFEAAVNEAGKREAAVTPAPAPGPMPAPAPNPIVPRPTPSVQRPVSRCDDLQQQRICYLNNGHLVVSDGCMKCI